MYNRAETRHAGCHPIDGAPASATVTNGPLETARRAFPTRGGRVGLIRRVIALLASSLLAVGLFAIPAAAASPLPAPVQVAPIPVRPMAAGGTVPVVRVLYVRPTDRAFNPAYSAAITNAVTSIQSFYGSQLGGKSFTLSTTTPETCVLPQASSYYVNGSWTKVFNDVQACAPVTYASSSVVWVLYVDVLDSPGCGTDRLGAGTPGLAMLPRADLEGLVGHTARDACGGAYTYPVNRWIGGLGHELGHALGLSHPPGCDQPTQPPTCDYNALMWAGFYNYPNTYLRSDDKAILLASPFIDFSWTNRGLALRHTGPGGYELRSDGSLVAFGGAPDFANPGSRWNWDIARSVVLLPDDSGGYVMDGWGGIHPFGNASYLDAHGVYWSGWDIAQAMVLTPDGKGGYLLDGFGGVHPLGNAPAVDTHGAYWPNWDIARSIVVTADGRGGYILDGWGGVHQFGNAPAIDTHGAYWKGWDIARAITLTAPGSGYLLDGFGGVHPLGNAAAIDIHGAYWPNHDIARGIAATPSAGVWDVDATYGVHHLG